MDFSGKVAIVTGASTLIGETVVVSLKNAGAKVVMADIAVEAGQIIAARLGEDVLFVPTDITDDRALDALITQAETRFGGVDYLVNIASTYLDGGVNTNRADWMTALNVNLVSGAVLTSKVAPIMGKRGGGAIVNFASTAGYVATHGRMTYSAAKAAIIQITKNQAMQLQPLNIRVNSVSPGWIWSNVMINLVGENRERIDHVAKDVQIIPRVGDPTEVSETVLFLLSEKASFITGADIHIDGGLMAMGPERNEDQVAKLI